MDTVAQVHPELFAIVVLEKMPESSEEQRNDRLHYNVI